MSGRKAVRPLSDLLLMFAGPAIWFGHFAFIYGAETLICIGPAASADQRMFWTYAIATIAALASLGVLARRQASSTGFLPRAGLGLTLLAILGVVGTIIPATFLPLCASAD